MITEIKELPKFRTETEYVIQVTVKDADIMFFKFRNPEDMKTMSEFLKENIGQNEEKLLYRYNPTIVIRLPIRQNTCQ